MGRKARLNRGEMSAVRQALYRDDVRPLHLTGEGEAREFRYTVDHDGATTACTQITTPLYSEGSNPVSKDIKEDGIARSEHLKRLSVHGCRPPFPLGCGNHRNMLFAHHGRPYRSVGD